MIAHYLSREEEYKILDGFSSYIDKAEICMTDGHGEFHEFSEWVNLLLETLDEMDNSNILEVSITQTHHTSFYHTQFIEAIGDAFFLKFTIEDKMKMYEAFTSAIAFMQKILLFMLIVTGAPKRSIARPGWLN